MSDHDDLHDAKVSATHAALREVPPTALDARILSAASQAVAEDAAARARQARLRRWVPAVGVAATITLGIALSLQLLVLPRSTLDEKAAREQSRTKEMEGYELLERETPAAPEQVAPQQAPPAAAESIELPKVDSPAPVQAAAGGAMQPMRTPAAPIAAAPAPAVSLQQETLPAAAAISSEGELARKAIAAEETATLDRVEVTGARIKRNSASGESSVAPSVVAPAAAAVAAPAAAAAFAAPRPLEEWLTAIAALRAAGKTEDADREQRALCAAYPTQAGCKP